MNRDRIERCKESSFRILERTNVTIKEMKDKLAKKEYTEEEINKTIIFLLEYNYLDDEAYVNNYYKNHIKKDGLKKIKFNLRRKGINDNVLCLLEEDNDAEYEGALNLAEKKYNQIQKREDDIYKRKTKLFSYLMSRGYSYDLIKKVVDQLLSHIER